ncbi:hypothetical protein CI1B_20460 [Bradyrhizobium ivorense]|uniref:DUF6875 domain-containing protein n=1 Tax=Bradyrhizobium ivorense TaxID=2511166 RepID=A0A508T3I4_9BRAD|nr:hypothetical protein [Bradyrhizobium ivorense]VIO68284.1 hypothetical protein CI1B_20460 [Bradyrhizobium ivorense]
MTHVDTFDAAAAGSAPVNFLPTQNTNLFALDDLDYLSMTRTLAESDLTALQAVADWIRTFVARPHKDLGHDGAVCPFVPAARERKTIWLAPERIAKLSVPEVVQLVKNYKKLFMEAQSANSHDAHYRSIVLVFTDLASDRARDLFDDVLQHLAVPSYVEDGLVLGAFYERNEATAIHSSSFRPFTPPVPFLLMRPAVISDWEFFLESEDWLDRWVRRFGASAVRALADELRQLPWRKSRSSF